MLYISLCVFSSIMASETETINILDSELPVVTYYDEEYRKTFHPHCHKHIPEDKSNEINTNLKWALLSNNGFAPFKASPGSAGYDLSASKECTIVAGEKGLINTDIQIWVPSGTYGRIAPRSGLALNQVTVGAGTIDQDYRGEVKVLLYNLSKDMTFYIKRGDRIAQLICEKIEYPSLEKCETLPNTKRGKRGFGSSDKRYTYNDIVCLNPAKGVLYWCKDSISKNFCTKHLVEEVSNHYKDKSEKIKIQTELCKDQCVKECDILECTEERTLDEFIEHIYDMPAEKADVAGKS